MSSNEKVKLLHVLLCFLFMRISVEKLPQLQFLLIVVGKVKVTNYLVCLLCVHEIHVNNVQMIYLICENSFIKKFTDYIEKKATSLGLEMVFLLTTRTADW